MSISDSLFSLLIQNASVIFVYMSLFFALSRVLNRNDIADIAWGLGFIVIAISTLVAKGEVVGSDWIFLSCVTIWGLRLAFYIGMRNHGKPEDVRYQKMKKDWGKYTHIKSFFIVFMFQGLLMYIVSLPLVGGFLIREIHLPAVFVVGLVLWVVGFLWEAVADAQKSAFKQIPENKNKTITTGLWKYSRHPNYFGEILLWWGIWVMALSNPYLFLTIVGPLTLTFLMTRVSGPPMLEGAYRQRPEFAAYREKTNKYIPWFLRR